MFILLITPVVYFRGVNRDRNYVELFWNSLDNAPSSIVFDLEMKVELEVGVHDIKSWFTPRFE